MLEVVSLDEARRLVGERFATFGVDAATERVALDAAIGRVLAQDVVSDEGIPPFDRSTVDGYAVMAADTFGSSDALPALLDIAGEIDMGAEPPCACVAGACLRIPTGGKVPEGADAVVMLEYCEEYGDGTVGVAKPVAPGENIVFRYDDIKPGTVLIPAGTVLQPYHIGTLASLGMSNCDVRRRVRAGIISTGDEIVDVDQVPVASQMRDVNAPMFAAAVQSSGAEAVRFPIVRDDYDSLLATVQTALDECDIVLVSGGSSAGAKDNTARVLSALGELLFHGIAVKPGKPTMCADAQGKPIFGLPGHPVAAYFMFLELAWPLLLAESPKQQVAAVVTEGLPSNHGRTELVPVRLEACGEKLQAVPIRSKSGLISQLASADGYITIDRNCEGIAAGAEVEVTLF